jgi:opacity protein-like surface antigen
MKRLIFVTGLIAAVASPAAALAQEQRAFVGLFIGGTIANQGGGTFGGAVGMKTSDRVTIFGEFGRMTNLLPKSAADEIQTRAAQVAGSLGGSASPIAKTRTNYGMVGARVNTGFVPNVNTFVELGVGAGSVSTDLSVLLRGSETAQGEIGHLVSTPFTSSKATKPVMTIGGGVVLDVTSKTAIEAGIGYMRVFTSSPALNAVRVYGSYRVGF